MLAGWIWSSPIGTGALDLVAELDRAAQHLRRQEAGRALGLGNGEQLAHPRDRSWPQLLSQAGRGEKPGFGSDRSLASRGPPAR